MSFKFDPAGMMKGLSETPMKVDTAVKMFAETNAKKLEGSARKNRPWTDRTSAARQRLQGTVEKRPGGYRIVLSHGVDYGVWLELAHEKTYAIIEPTIRLESPSVMKDFNGFLSKIK